VLHQDRRGEVHELSERQCLVRPTDPEGRTP
jgi:hypothetical protein